MALQPVIQNRDIDFESEKSLLNVAGITLVNAAVAANEPMRKGEVDAAIAAITFDNVVESTEVSLAAYIAANGTGLAEGTLLILANAPERESRFVRRDVAESNDGTENDFYNINASSNFIRSDLTDQYGGSDGVFLDDVNGFIGISDGSITPAKAHSTFFDSVKGDAATYTDLGLVEDELQSLATEQATHSKSVEYPVAWGAPDGNGESTALIDTSADFGTKSVTVRVLKDVGGGFFEHISTSALVTESSATAVRLRTDSGSITSATLTVEVTGVPVV